MSLVRLIQRLSSGLTAEGEITDRHSGIHMAAMVECLLF